MGWLWLMPHLCLWSFTTCPQTQVWTFPQMFACRLHPIQTSLGSRTVGVISHVSRRSSAGLGTMASRCLRGQLVFCILHSAVVQLVVFVHWQTWLVRSVVSCWSFSWLANTRKLAI